MDLHLHSHQFTQRWPDWQAAANAGLVGGVALLLLEMVASAMIGFGFWAPTRMIAAMVMGNQVIVAPATFDIAVFVTALVLHFAMAALMGLVLGLVMAPFRFDSSFGLASVVGALFGLAMYLFDFHALNSLFPWVVQARGWGTLIAYLIFGVLAADAYVKLERPQISETMQ